MKNIVPEQIPALLTLAGDAADGAGLYQAALLLLQNTKANIEQDINPLVDAIMAHGTGKTELTIRRETARTLLDTSRLFLTVGRDSFKPMLGFEYNQNWDITGLVDSLAIPRSAGDVLPLLTSYKEVLGANPALELVAKDITSIRAGELFTQLKAARSAVNAQETMVETLQDDRDAKATTLRKRIRGLIDELYQRMDPLDARWLAFGLNKPGAQETPEGVGTVTASLIGPGTAALKWNSTARADYYHVFKRVQGTDTEFVLVGSPADLDFNLENLPAGSTIEIVVSAGNSGGEGQRSEAVTLVTH